MKLTDAYDKVMIAIATNTPVMLWGSPGIGKSDIVHQIGAELSRMVLDIRLAQLEPTDLRGVPMPNKDTGKAQWFLPQFWPDRAEHNIVDEETGKVTVKAGNGVNGPGILFLDEIEKAPVSVKNASLQLVLNRMIGSYKLPNDWAIVCAGNREDDGCFSAPLGQALANRMMHIEVDADVGAWTVWAKKNDVSDDVIGFLNFRQDLLYKQTNENAFPSPRSWVMGSNLMKMSKNDKDKKDLLASAVGVSSASEFSVWSNIYRNIKPKEILDGKIPKEFNERGKDQSLKYAVAMSVAFYLNKRKKGIEGIEENVANFINVLPTELRVIFWNNFSVKDMKIASEHKAFTEVISQIMSSIA